jgi:hypothetical protein
MPNTVQCVTLALGFGMDVAKEVIGKALAFLSTSRRPAITDCLQSPSLYGYAGSAVHWLP